MCVCVCVCVYVCIHTLGVVVNRKACIKLFVLNLTKLTNLI